MLKMISELKLELSDNCENKETIISHSEQIRAKLNIWKPDNSKAVATNTIHQFLKKEVKPTNNHLTNQTEKLEDKPISTNENMETNDQKKTIIEFKPESNDDSDEKIMELVNISNNKNTDVAEYYDASSNNDEKYYNVDHIHEFNNSKSGHVKDINIYCDSSKVKTDVNIEIDISVAPKERKCAIVEINLEQIKLRLKRLKTQLSGVQKMKTRFYATIDPSKNQQAEHELSKEISKDMFSRVSKHIFTGYFYMCKIPNTCLNFVYR